MNLARIHNIYLGHNQIAKGLYNRALQYARKAKDISLEAEILIQLGFITNKGGRKLFERAAKISINTNNSLYVTALSRLLIKNIWSGNTGGRY